MTKRLNTYRLTIESLFLSDSSQELREMQLDFENHDEVFDIILRVQEKQIFHTTQQAAEFAIGLKLFSEAMIKNRDHPLFQEFLPAFRVFMKDLKAILPPTPLDKAAPGS